VSDRRVPRGILDLIRRGAAIWRCASYDIRHFPEFADVFDAPDFLAAQVLVGPEIPR
jgi:hypothetical protein